jgi:pyridoxamine 5'-phosphate oxidase
MIKDYSEFREEYTKGKLTISQMHDDPLTQFSQWMEEAVQSEVTEPNAMVLSTVSEDMIPSSRTVLLKAVSKDGFVFFTNYQSKKGRQIEKNNRVSLLFYWQALERQVKIEGKAQKIADTESDRYFLTRPEGSRLGAWASPQSEVIPNRSYIEKLEEDYRELFKNKPIKRPSHWGGYAVQPMLMEFWQGRNNRLHDRIEYKKEGNIWDIHRLAP